MSAAGVSVLAPRTTLIDLEYLGDSETIASCLLETQGGIAIVDPGSAPMKRLKDEAKQAGKLVDATNGRRTRSIIVTDSDHIVLSAIQTETIAQRFEADVVLGRTAG